MQKGFNNINNNFKKALGYKYLIATIVFLAWLLFFDENSIVSHQKNKQKLGDLIQQKEYYKSRIQADRQKLKDLNSGTENLEKFAREQYYMSRPDEDVFIIEEKR